MYTVDDINESKTDADNACFQCGNKNPNYTNKCLIIGWKVHLQHFTMPTYNGLALG